MKLLNPETINADLGGLPVAELVSVYHLVDGIAKPIETKRGVKVNDGIVAVLSDKYKLVQHKDAFRPIVEGLTVMGKDFKYALWANNKKAEFYCYVDELNDGSDGIVYGFKAWNAFDGSSAINYGFKVQRKQKFIELVEKEKVLVWGYRKVCENGMIIKVPLLSEKYISSELRVKLTELHKQVSSIRHMGDVEGKLREVQYTVEAITLLRNPIERMIKDSQKMLIDLDYATKLVKKYVGRRKRDEILERFGREEQTLFGIFNSITYIASHSEVKHSTKNGLLLRAANLLEKELIAPSII